MPAEGMLRRRIVRACLVLAAVLCAVYAAVIVTSMMVIEDRLLNDRLDEAADQLITNHLQGFRGEVPGDPRVYEGAAIPPQWRDLPVGMHEVDEGKRVLHVLVRERAGRRFAVVDDESDFEELEALVWSAVAAAFVLCMGLAVVLGRMTATRVIQPVVALADAVREGRLADDAPALGAADEVGVLARALAAHQQQMQRFLAREQLFTGDVSHELRTPLTVILGAAEVLQARLADRPDLLPAVERIRRTAVETADRVAALLLLSRAPEALDAPSVELLPLVQREMERCRPLLQGKPVQLQLQVEHEERVAGRPELIAIALGNLIRNACQFTEQGRVQVTLERGRILVSDSGPGVPEAIRSQVFERFVRADTSVPGTGLGLAIVQRVCAHLGWSITLSASDVGGCCFEIGLAP
ncbi:HAMP domain-containing histidine kinase [Ramlibacter sp. G-1-2-2]|uniref:histidine kinase n=1 Tax=Ramlibacter agri TaxID=2728837 RepID=A0A848GWG0_9BURK|nr:HAMP domain-containing sensor histidine kinase [Ramlibacter agri]NML42945.1 HAMP domain-containing histidine kinase [Ramlibacter agri]